MFIVATTAVYMYIAANVDYYFLVAVAAGSDRDELVSVSAHADQFMYIKL